MTKAKKSRPEHYEKPLAIDGTFGQVIRVAVGKKDEVKKERAKAVSKDVLARFHNSYIVPFSKPHALKNNRRPFRTFTPP